MFNGTRFTVLIERRLRRVARLLALCLAMALPGVAAAQALPATLLAKLAPDLRAEMASVKAGSARWVRELHGVRHVEVIVVVSNGAQDLTDLRSHVGRLGGVVRREHRAVHAVTAQVPLAQLALLARRSDVLSISPNRTAYASTSTMEAITGSGTSQVRSYLMPGMYSGLDGSGVGIAVLDSGVMKAHRSFTDSMGFSRVRRSVDMLKSRGGLWSSGFYDGSMSYAPGSIGLQKYESLVANDSNALQDPYGHGTHVASIAAGRGYYQTPDTTGVAPNADLFDVRVLDDQGIGTTSDVIEGIEWVIYHAREYNIRVMNISLATNSTESWRTDPLCMAVRSASAAGITVVAAAGNFG
ncbi:MAG TPA: S8 family serine peptidase, partial [Albitalea sp.]|nr:S8 family serine peptidase [Albitalea sp.]